MKTLVKTTAKTAPAPSITPVRKGLLQRKCACGGTPGPTGECAECRRKRTLGLQTNLRVNQPGDRYEQEADRVAEHVMRMPAPARLQGELRPQPGHSLQRMLASGASAPAGLIQRQDVMEEEQGISSETSDDLDKEQGSVVETNESKTDEATGSESAAEPLVEEEAPVMTKSTDPSAAPIRYATPPEAAGHAMDEGRRAQFESYFGHDFSGVRLHTDASAHRFTERLRARAATMGNHIYFARDALQTGGRRLLAHELTHVVQQQAAPALQMNRRGGVSGSGSSLEAEANRAAHTFAQGRSFSVAGRVAPSIQRYQSRICVGETNEHASRQPRDFPRTYISEVAVNLASQQISLTWTGPSASSQPTGPYNCSTGGGVCGRTSCNNRAHSRLAHTCCTPIGTWPVLGQSCRTPRLSLQNFTNFQRSGIGLHYYGSVPRRPVSHGCVRLGRRASEIVFDSVRRTHTNIRVHGSASRHRCHPAADC